MSGSDAKLVWLERLGVTALPAAAGISTSNSPGGGADGSSSTPAKLVLTHETEAKAPPNRKRTKLGVGERVILKVSPGPGQWVATGGKLSSTNGLNVTFTAQSSSGKAKVTVTVGDQ